MSFEGFPVLGAYARLPKYCFSTLGKRLSDAKSRGLDERNVRKDPQAPSRISLLTELYVLVHTIHCNEAFRHEGKQVSPRAGVETVSEKCLTPWNIIRSDCFRSST